MPAPPIRCFYSLTLCALQIVITITINSNQESNTWMLSNITSRDWWQTLGSNVTSRLVVTLQTTTTKLTVTTTVWQCRHVDYGWLWFLCCCTCITIVKQLVGWLSGRTSVSDRRTFTGLHRTCSWWITIYMGKPSAVGQPTRPTQPFILTGSINE